jgi:hypothetical protein
MSIEYCRCLVCGTCRRRELHNFGDPLPEQWAENPNDSHLNFEDRRHTCPACSTPPTNQQSRRILVETDEPSRGQDGNSGQLVGPYRPLILNAGADHPAGFPNRFPPEPTSDTQLPGSLNQFPRRERSDRSRCATGHPAKNRDRHIWPCSRFSCSGAVLSLGYRVVIEMISTLENIHNIGDRCSSPKNAEFGRL